jgi:hypothetical protein
MGSGASRGSPERIDFIHSSQEIPMSINAPSFYAQQFANQVMLLSQQKTSRLQTAVTVGTGHRGEQASPVDQVGSIEASEKTERFAPMPRTDAPVDRRWVLPRTWDINQNYDKHDLIRQIQDPRSALAQAALAAMGRRKDLTILDGLLNTNYTGKNGTTSTSFLSGNVVGVNTGGSASTFNVAKLRKAKQLLMANDVDVTAEELYVAIDSRAHDALLAEVQVTSKDYNEARDGKPVLKDGVVERFLGFNIIWTERVLSFNGTDDQSGTSTPCPAWAKSGAYLGIWDDVNTVISERNDLRGIPWQLYTDGTFGGCRLEEKKVVKIWSR